VAINSSRAIHFVRRGCLSVDNAIGSPLEASLSAASPPTFPTAPHRTGDAAGGRTSGKRAVTCVPLTTQAPPPPPPPAARRKSSPGRKQTENCHHPSVSRSLSRRKTGSTVGERNSNFSKRDRNGASSERAPMHHHVQSLSSVAPIQSSESPLKCPYRTRTALP